MSVLTNVERHSRHGLLFQALVTVVLIVGSTAMIYPFMLMFSGAMRSEMDSAEMDPLPDYLVDTPTLTRKYLETKYNHNVSAMNPSRGYTDFSFAKATLPSVTQPARENDFRVFFDEVKPPHHWYFLGGTEQFKLVPPRNLERFIDRLKTRYNGDLSALSRDLGVAINGWRGISFRSPEWTNPRFNYEPSAYWDEYFALAQERPLAEMGFVSVSGWFLENVIYPRYGRSSVTEYNRAHTTKIDSYQDFALPRRIPDENQPALRAEWIEFVRNMINSSFVRTDEPDADYQDFLNNKYGDISKLNNRWNIDTYDTFDQIELPNDRDWVPAAQRPDYEEYLSTVDPEKLYLVGPAYAWWDWLEHKYGQIDALNQEYATPHAAWSQVDIPIADVELAYVRANAGSLRWEYATRNFRVVFDEILLQGRPFTNTLVYVGLSLLLSLSLQPLAAYGLSRFEPPGTWRLLLIFMATMAFPPMVGLIPQFLILQKTNMLNTFVALVLPIIVNGYLVFLLKGFFDSLPKHLYEAAVLDGASEIRIFLEITMALSKPILAVVALQTFNHAWLAFMYPLLVCPAEDMQVLAVWLYQFQQRADSPTVFASIMVTSIPTLLVFIFTQRTIMRGIAVPAEK